MNVTQKKLSIVFVLIIGFIAYSPSLSAEVRLTYKVGDGLKIGDGENLLTIQGRLQGRFTYTALAASRDTDTFAVQRGKLKIEGHLLDKVLLYGLQLNAATRAAESTSGLTILEDFYFDWVPTRYFGIKGGQYKVPFLIQELTSSGKLQFVDRSLGTGPFNFGRDVGATVHGTVTSRDLTYYLFVINGDGINTLNRNRGFLTGTRLEVPLLGNYVWSESDTDQSEEPNLGLGLAYAYNEAVAATQNGVVAAGIKASHGTLDVGYKYLGWSFQGAGMITRTMEAASLTNWGYHAQLGKFLLPKKFEIAARTSSVVFSNAVVNQHEYTLGLNTFIAGHGIKWQNDYSFLPNSRGQDVNDHRIRTQMQVVF